MEIDLVYVSRKYSFAKSKGSNSGLCRNPLANLIKVILS